MLDARVINALKQELHNAEVRHRSADEQLRETSRLTHELHMVRVPEPDGTQTLRQAIANERDTHRAHFEALKQLSEYLLHGTIPAHLK